MEKFLGIVCPLSLLIFIIVVLSIVEIIHLMLNKSNEKRLTSQTCCPRCNRNRFHSIVTKEVIIPEKTKTQTSLNMNPLKPFTVLDHKEKVVRQEISREVTKFVCDDCGYVWK